MRLLILTTVIFHSCFSFGQNNFYDQVHSIIKDSANDFKKFRQGVKSTKAGTNWYSSITVEGTYENEIWDDSIGGMYATIIVDSVKKNKGKKIVAEWKEKIESVLGGHFTGKRLKVVPWNPAQDGWKFTRGGRFELNIDLYPVNDDKSSIFRVVLSFWYSPDYSKYYNQQQ